MKGSARMLPSPEIQSAMEEDGATTEDEETPDGGAGLEPLWLWLSDTEEEEEKDEH